MNFKLKGMAVSNSQLRTSISGELETTRQNSDPMRPLSFDIDILEKMRAIFVGDHGNTIVLATKETLPFSAQRISSTTSRCRMGHGCLGENVWKLVESLDHYLL